MARAWTCSHRSPQETCSPSGPRSAALTDWLATLTDRHAIARGRASHLVADALGSSDTDVTSQVAALRDELAADTSASVA